MNVSNDNDNSNDNDDSNHNDYINDISCLASAVGAYSY